MNQDPTIELVQELIASARKERELVTAGRLDDATAAMAERAARMVGLPNRDNASGTLRALLDELFEEGERSLTLLRAIRDELGDELRQGSDQRHALHSYGDASRL